MRNSPLIHHLALTVSDLKTSKLFYDGLLGRFGYTSQIFGDKLAAWEGPDSELLLYQANDDLVRESHVLYKPGFHHLALCAQSRSVVDEVGSWARSVGALILEGPAEYPDYPGDYYAIFFLDPDGLKLEVMHIEHSETVVERAQ